VYRSSIEGNAQRNNEKEKAKKEKRKGKEENN
jgi:hypothetical protein